MHTQKSIAQIALALLAIDPDGAGVTVDCGNVRIYIDEKQGFYTARIERVVLPAVFATCADETKVLASFFSRNLQGICRELEENLSKCFGSREFEIDRLFYRKSEFGGAFSRRWPVDSSTVAVRHSKWWGWLKFLPFDPLQPDTEFESFLNDGIEKAFSWGTRQEETISRFSEIQLWFHGEGCSAAYVKVKRDDKGIYDIVLEDRLCWPWRKEHVLERVDSVELAKKAIHDYMSRTHGFEFNAMSISFFHTPDLRPADAILPIEVESAPASQSAWEQLEFIREFLSGRKHAEERVGSRSAI
jgi:hypothetical protein